MELRIEDMTCSGCARSVTKAIHSVDPAAKVDADPAARKVMLQTGAEPTVILKVLEEIGYPATAI